MKLHILKIRRDYLFDIMFKGKTFELRKDDREYEVGDLIHFVDPDGKEYFHYSDMVFKIHYILRDVPQYGLASEFCILAIRPFTEN